MNIIEHINLVPQSYAKDIEYELSSSLFPWYYNPSTVDISYDTSDINIIPTSQYTHQIYAPSIQPSYLYQFVKPIVYFIEDKLSLKVKGVDRIKANALERIPNYTLKNYNPPHWDSDPKTQSNRLSCVYYVNTADGDTRIFNKKYPDSLLNASILDQFEPKKGYATLFNSDYWHCGSNPILNNRRIVLNFVLEITT